MSTLWLTPGLVKEIIAHVNAQFPREACGLLLGDGHRVTVIVPTENVSTTPSVSYEIDGALLAAYLPDTIGFYHSHPHGEALPSRSDIQESCYPEHVYLIVGMRDRLNPELAAWQIGDHRVRRMSIDIGTEYFDGAYEKKDALAEGRVIILSILIGVLMVLLVSVTLLPPAPPIP